MKLAIAGSGRWNRNLISLKATSVKPTSPEIRNFERRDLRRVVEIERGSFGRDAWRPELFLAYWQATPDFFFVARLGRRIAGYSVARIDWRGGDLESIAVDPRYRGRGVAQALLNATIRDLRSQRIGALRLMVSVKNESALRFYLRAGFVRVRRVKDYYDTGRDAWRMRLHL
jgi:ribosomal-protein-alanine N-acetyltransferase